MKATIHLVFVCLFSMSTFFAVAQNPLERAWQRAESRSQENVNQRVDESVDEAIDNLFKKRKPKGSKGKNAEEGQAPANGTDAGDALGADDGSAADFSEMLGSMLRGGDWTPYENPRHFSYTMEITTTKKNGKSENSVMDIAVVSNQVGMRMAQLDTKEQSRMILNTADGKTTVIATDRKGKSKGYRMRMPTITDLGAPSANLDHDNSTITVNKTGEKKVVDGYHCEKIIVTDEEEGATTTAWITQDLNIDMADLMRPLLGMVSGGQMDYFPNFTKQQEILNGLIILATQVDKRGEQTEVRYRNIQLVQQTNRAVLDVSDVAVQEVGY